MVNFLFYKQGKKRQQTETVFCSVRRKKSLFPNLIAKIGTNERKI